MSTDRGGLHFLAHVTAEAPPIIYKCRFKTISGCQNSGSQTCRSRPQYNKIKFVFKLGKTLPLFPGANDFFPHTIFLLL